MSGIFWRNVGPICFRGGMSDKFFGEMSDLFAEIEISAGLRASKPSVIKIALPI
jgi:hypothetical protein